MITFGDLAVRVRGRHFLFSSVHPALLPQRQTATANTEPNKKGHPQALTVDCEINKYAYEMPMNHRD